MQIPAPDESPARLRLRLIFHLAVLHAAGVLSNLIEGTEALLARVKASRTRRDDDEEAQVRALAVRGFRDGTADEAVRAFEHDLSGLCNLNHGDPRYLRCFGKRTMGAVVKLPLKDEIAELRRLATLLELPEFEPLKAKHGPALAAAADRLEEGCGNFEAVLTGRAATTYDLDALRLDVTRLLQSDYADLLALHPHDKDRVERFFYRFERPAPEKEEPPVATPGSGT